MRLRQISNETLTCNFRVKLKFRIRFHKLIKLFTRNYLKAFNSLSKISWDPGNDRHSLVNMFLLNAFNNLMISTNLLLTGLLVPSGNLMRNFTESIAITLLCSSNHLDIYERIRRDKLNFPYHDAISLLLRKKSLQALNLAGDGSNTMQKVTKLYNMYSHSTYFAASTQYSFSNLHKLYIGAFYDKDKDKYYVHELQQRDSACNLLGSVIELIARSI